MDAWTMLYKEVVETIESESADILFFRGHSNTSWKLWPTLARVEETNRDFAEKCSYFDFLTRAGSLLPENNSSWNNAFAMQHHGLPTRLLDWSENFVTALYFALKGAQGTCCVWVLNPFTLNETTINREELLRPQDLNGTYDDYFVSESRKIEGKVIAVSPLRHHPRVFHQRAGFTIHGDLTTPLESLYPKTIKKIVIPPEAQHGARQFLKLVGISEFTLFPDLDGLARELNDEHFKKQI